MSFILDHFWKFVLLIILAIGGWIGWKKFEDKETWNHHVAQIAGAFAEFNSAEHKDADEVRASYWMLLTIIKDYQTAAANGTIKPLAPENLDPTLVRTKEEEAMEWMLDASMKQVGDGNSNARAAFKSTLIENLNQCENLGIFDSESNVNSMIKGQSPVIKSGIYSGHKLVIAPRISVNVAREAYNEPANFVLVPDVVAGIESPELGQKEKEAAIILKNAGLIGQNTFEAVNRMVEDAKR